MKKYSITGMSCAACSARVERATLSVEGVSSCSVSLLTNSMLVEGGDEEKIFEAVRGAGYGIAPDTSDDEDALAVRSKREIRSILSRLIASLLILLPLMYITMGYVMWDFPLPLVLKNSPLAIAIIELVLSLAVMVINRHFFINGVRHAFSGGANMDTLVALGSGVSFLWSVYLVVMMGISSPSESHEYLHKLYFESAAMILTLITVGKLLEAIAKGKTTSAISALIKLTPKTVTVIRDGKECVVLSKEITRGEVFVVKAGEIVAVDGVLISGEGVADESSLTGESMPVNKMEGSDVYAGTILTSGYIKCEATRVGEDTTMAKVVRLVSDASASKAPVAKVADRVSSVFVPIVLLIALITTVSWLFIGGGVGHALERGISVLVISCPCALGLATPVAIMVGVGIGARSGALFKTASSLEALGRVKNIALDKTGTLTLGIPEVVEVYPVGVSEGELIALAYSVERQSEHPIAGAVVRYAEGLGISVLDTEKYESRVGIGVFADIEDKRVAILSYAGAKSITELSEVEEGIYRRMSSEAKTPIFVLSGDTLVGILAISDTIKEDARESVGELKRLGLNVVMITGDNELSANAVANSLGGMSVISGVLPDGKAEAIKQLSGSGGVAMVGDGINDAPSLALADVGIAIGTGTDIAIDSADVVLTKPTLSELVGAVRLSRATLKTIYENLFWAFIYNVIGIPLAAGVFTALLGWELTPMFGAMAMSLSSFTVVMNALRLGAKKHFKVLKASSDTTLNENNNMIGDNSKMEKVFSVEGMMCPHCEAHVVKAVMAIPGVKEAAASHKDGTLKVIYEGALDVALIVGAVADAGYKVL